MIALIWSTHSLSSLLLLLFCSPQDSCRSSCRRTGHQTSHQAFTAMSSLTYTWHLIVLSQLAWICLTSCYRSPATQQGLRLDRTLLHSVMGSFRVRFFQTNKKSYSDIRNTTLMHFICKAEPYYSRIWFVLLKQVGPLVKKTSLGQQHILPCALMHINTDGLHNSRKYISLQ